MISHAAEDYLKAIYKLWHRDGKVGTSAIAAELGVSAASVTTMISKLAELHLVGYTPYRGVALTKAGEKMALEIIRHHRLLELYLAEALGYTWDKVHEEAEKLEHVISREFVEKMDQYLGYPDTDPHGDPIPTKEGTVDEKLWASLADTTPGQSVIIRRVNDTDSEKLQYLGELGLTPDARVQIIAKAPFNGPLKIRIGSKEHHLGQELAHHVFVDRVETEETRKE